jgi:long-subunit acyl-CoA synthetase (AMP-forming)
MSETQATSAAALDTFPKLLADNARRRPERPAAREKDLGIWQSWTWSEVAEQVRALACGLAALGLKRGDKVAIVGDNRPRLYWTMTAAQALGAVPVPLYQDAVAEEMAFVIDHAEVRFAMVEDQEQVDKLLEIKAKNPRIEKIVFDEERGLRHYEQDFLHSFEAIQEIGREHDRANPGFYDAEVAKGTSADTAIILYTSGTTGQPKGVVLSFTNLVQTARNSIEFDSLDENESVLAYLPMAWVGDHLFSYGQSYVAGFCVSCPESTDTVLSDLRELGPTYFFAPPAIFERILTTVMIRMEDAGWIKRKAFHYFMAVAKRCGIEILDGKPVGFGDRLLYGLGRLLIYGPLLNTLGFSRLRLAYTAGEAIGPDIFDFYRSLGVNLKQLYGSTEASVSITAQPDGEVLPDTVGRPSPEVEIKITEAGEVMFRSPGVFVEYYKNPEETANTKTEDGWVHTGDRPRQGRGQADQRHPVRAQIHREQAQVLPRDQGGGGLRPRPGFLRRLHQHRSRGGRQLGRTPQHRLRQLSGFGSATTGPPDSQGPRREGQPRPGERPESGRFPNPALPGPAQGTGPGRRRIDPDPQGAPQFRGREVPDPGGSALLRRRARARGNRGDLRGRAQGLDRRRSRHRRRRDLPGHRISQTSKLKNARS